MELREYVAIFKKKSKLFITVVALLLLAGVLYQLFQPLGFKSSLTLNVTRKGSQETGDYKFDDFYRLQADERFADTVVRWLESPRIAADILAASGVDESRLTLRQLGRYFRAQRLSSQMIKVTYFANDAGLAKKLSKSILTVLNNNSDKLNEMQHEESWFIIVGENPIVKESKVGLFSTMLICLLAGIFIGSWAVFIKHYLE